MVMTERGYEDPGVRQLAVFLQNRVGQLRDVLKTIDSAGAVVQALSVQDGADFAVLRVVVDRHEDAAKALKQAAFPAAEVTVLAVEVPDAQDGLLAVCRALIQSEINIHYCFPMVTRPRGVGAVVFNVDSIHAAVETLRRNGFRLLDETDLHQKA
jgi:hypothetical protein